MTDLARHFTRSATIAAKMAHIHQHRIRNAAELFTRRLSDAAGKAMSSGLNPVSASSDAAAYATDFAQRSILLSDTLRQRGDNFLEHERAGLPPVLHFDYEVVLDGREFERPVNYSMVRIVPPPGVKVDPRRRPYLIIDPRAGHGPGIGGFKDDSQVGVALRDGHPVYFVIFYQHPEPGQTLLDVCEAERIFVRKLHELHPHSRRPAIVGNCQGGWAAMMVAATLPEYCGPLVINGAPMSYWGGAWSEGKSDNAMRYSGGLLGGSWLSSLTADLGNGIFDGAWLVSNFEGLNPANSCWGKLYNVFARVDSEPERYLDFERWSWSSLNPWTAWLAPAASQVREQRQPVAGDQPFRQMESAFSDFMTASLDCYRAFRDASVEAACLGTFGGLYSLYLADEAHHDDEAEPSITDPRERELVREILAGIGEGGYSEAVARVGYLLWREGESLELWQIERRAELMKEYRDLLPDLPAYQMREIRGRQSLICTFERERAIETLPQLLTDPADRARLAELLQRVESDPRVDAQSVTARQRQTYDRILSVLGTPADAKVQPIRRARPRRRAS